MAKLGKVSRPPEARRRNALWALTLLGRHHPEDVDPFFTGLLSTTNRHESIPLLGYMGDRHFDFLTNLIAGPNLELNTAEVGLDAGQCIDLLTDEEIEFEDGRFQLAPYQVRWLMGTGS